jgi:mono/diheme cytochrome c family protein
MPFTSYTYMTDADVLAIKAYLFSLPAVHAPARPDTLSFPFNQRALMALWAMAFSGHERFRPDPQQTPEWNRGAYLAEAVAHCGECHTPRNVAFALNERRKFGGAVTAGWRAYNISADRSTGIGAWSDAEVTAYLRDGHVPGHGTASGPMGEAVDDSLSQLDYSDIAALVAYVRSVPATVSRELPAHLAAAASASHREGPQHEELGKQLFAGACVSCHGWSGASEVSDFATLTGARAVNDPSGTNVAQAVLAGVDRSTPHGILRMPAFGSYSNAEVAALTNYVTARFGDAPAALTADDVASLRRQTQQ